MCGIWKSVLRRSSTVNYRSNFWNFNLRFKRGERIIHTEGRRKQLLFTFDIVGVLHIFFGYYIMFRPNCPKLDLPVHSPQEYET